MHELSSHNFVFLVVKRAIVVAALICLATSMVSCRTIKTVTVEVPVHVHDTTYIAHHIHDSVYIENTEYVKGDTVFKTKVKYVEKLKFDTVYEYIEKPVNTVTEVVKTQYVEKELRWWQKSLMFFGALLLFGIIIYIAMLCFAIKKA